MKKLAITISLAFAALPLRPALACEHTEEADVAALKYANLVVVGRIVHYEIVRDQEARKQPSIPGRTTYIEDYARFEVLVDEILLGSAQRTLQVTWDGQWMAEPDTMPSGPFLVALRDASQLATDRVRGDRAAPTVLQMVCQDAFIIPADSAEAKAVRQILRELD